MLYSIPRTTHSVIRGVQVFESLSTDNKTCSTAIFDKRCVKNKFEYCHQVALPCQPCSNNEDLYQTLGGISKWSLRDFLVHSMSI